MKLLRQETPSCPSPTIKNLAGRLRGFTKGRLVENPEFSVVVGVRSAGKDGNIVLHTSQFVDYYFELRLFLLAPQKRIVRARESETHRRRENIRTHVLRQTVDMTAARKRRQAASRVSELCTCSLALSAHRWSCRSFDGAFSGTCYRFYLHVHELASPQCVRVCARGA